MVIDLFEYTTDALARIAYPSSDTANTESVSQQQTTSNDGTPLGDIANNEYRCAQGFQLSVASEISAVEIKRFALTIGAPSGNWTLRIETDSSGLPSGTLANANASIVVTPPAEGAVIKGTFATPFTLSANTAYWLVVQCDNQTTDNYWYISWNLAGGYGSGTVAIYTSGAWTTAGYTGYDLYFKVYINTPHLQCYSEATIKQQGSYSLKAVALVTDSLNDTLTRTVSPVIDLTDINTFKYWARSSRTGSNFKIGLHDSGGNTIEHTPNISAIDTFEEQAVDISAVSNANKDAIDEIKFTILNADATNTIYWDNARTINSVTANISAALVLTSALQTPVIRIDKTISPSVLTMVSALQTPTIKTGVTVSPSAIALILALKAPTLKYDWVEHPSVLTLTLVLKTASINVFDFNYRIELRDKDGNLKQYITPFVSKCSWEWNRTGGCGRCSITINKAYRDIIFDTRDDIRIRIQTGITSKLVYRGYIANIIPTLQIDQKIVLDVRGYFDLLKKLIVNTAGDTRTYTSKTVGFIADDIADNFIVPNSPITISGPITAGSFTADTLEFLGTVDDALRTLSELQGDIEYGVNENLVFYWQTESTTINYKFFVGNNVSVLERRVNWDNLVNKIYLVGGDVAGVKYKKTAEATDSQAAYGLAEEIINNSSIISDSVAAQYMGAILTERSIPNLSIRASIKNISLRIEDTIPIGLVSFYDATYDSSSLGDVVGDIIGATVTIVSSSVANPSVITATAHGYLDGQSVVIAGHTGSTPSINGTHVITYINANSFSIPVNVTVGGTGGTAVSDPANGSDILIGLTADGGDNVTVGGQYSAQVNRIAYQLSNTTEKFNIEIQLGDTVLETAAKIKRLERQLASVTQY